MKLTAEEIMQIINDEINRFQLVYNNAVEQVKKHTGNGWDYDKAILLPVYNFGLMVSDLKYIRDVIMERDKGDSR